jgi:hypothetical protein
MAAATQKKPAAAILLISVAEAEIFVLSVKGMSHGSPNWLATFGAQWTK